MTTGTNGNGEGKKKAIIKRLTKRVRQYKTLTKRVGRDFCKESREGIY